MRASVRPWRALLAAVSLTVLGLAAARAADDNTDLKGNWKFSLVSPFSENDLMILTVKESDGKGKPAAVIKDTVPLPQPPEMTGFETHGKTVRFRFLLVGNEATFRGTTDDEGKVRGTMHFQGQVIPAQLEKTEEAKLVPRRPDAAVFRTFFEAQAEADPKAKVKKYEEMIHKMQGSPKAAMAYAGLLKAAGDARLDADKVRGYVTDWVQGARPYGSDYENDVRVQALKALSGEKTYADLTLQLAQDADKALDKDAPIETQAEIAKALASAAKFAGKDELARSAEQRSARLEHELDEEYHKKVPPFKPEISVGRKDEKSDRVVLLELFTGAQCPPCVAADVAFDGLIPTYKPSEVVLLQYHLHIPGPDPLTNADSVARAKYYPELRGTPSTFFNGKSEAGGGGPMSNGKTKYDQYRQIIDKTLEGHKQAALDLQVSRSGDTVKIVATARAEGRKKEKKADDDKDPPALRLRLALIEEEVKYVGGNKLRFHHHVVRAMPGGVEGKALADGQGKVEETVNLAELRQGLEQYLSDYAKSGSAFPNPLPEIKLGNLSVVAFLQDDADKSVLNAVLAPVGGAK